MTSIGYERISKKNFYRWGGFSNPKLFRRKTQRLKAEIRRLEKSLKMKHPKRGR